MKLRYEKSGTQPVMTTVELGNVRLTTYHGSPWFGVEIMRRCLFVTLFCRRFEFRILKTEEKYGSDHD